MPTDRASSALNRELVTISTIATARGFVSGKRSQSCWTSSSPTGCRSTAKSLGGAGKRRHWGPTQGHGPGSLPKPVTPNSRSHTEAWESITPTQGLPRKGGKEELGHNARFVVPIFLRLVREVTTDNSLKGAFAAVRALETGGCRRPSPLRSTSSLRPSHKGKFSFHLPGGGGSIEPPKT